MRVIIQYYLGKSKDSVQIWIFDMEKSSYGYYFLIGVREFGVRNEFPQFPQYTEYNNILNTKWIWKEKESRELWGNEANT